jgi:hypothetical protein
MPAAPAGWSPLAPLGIDCKLYTSPTFATPTRTEVTRAINVTQPMSKGKAELTSRLTRWKPKRPTLREVALDFGYRYTRGTDAVLAALRDSFLNDTNLIFWVLDGSDQVIGAQGLVFPGQVFDFPIDQQLEDGQIINIGVDLAEHYESTTLVNPSWFVQTV